MNGFEDEIRKLDQFVESIKLGSLSLIRYWGNKINIDRHRKRFITDHLIWTYFDKSEIIKMKEQTTSLSNHENSKKDSSKVEISKVEEDSSSHEYQQNIPINQDSDVNYDYNNNITSPINQPHISSSNLSPMAQGCYNNRFCCPMTQERKINTLLRALLAFSIIELICLPKYLILPIIVIQLLGGPILLVLPWCLLVLIIWSLQLFASVYTDCVSTIGLDQHDIPPTTIEIIVLNLNKCGINTSWFHTNQMNNNRSNAQSGVNQSNVEYGRSPFVTAISERQNEYGIDNTRVPSNEVQHIEFGISSNHTQSSTDGINKTNNGETVLTIHPSTAHIEGETKPQIDINSSSARPESNIQSIPHSPNTTNIRLTMTNGEVILWITACILDIILSIFSIVIGFILLIVCLTEADGLVVRGYESQYAAIVAETIFCVLSLIARLGFIIVIIFLRFNLPQLRSLSPWVIWQSQLLSSARAEEASSATSTGVDVVDMSNTNTNTNTNIISSSADAVIRNNNLSSISWYYAVSRNSIIYTSKVASTIISFSFALLGLVYTSININYAVSYSNYRSIDKVTYSNCDNMVSQYCSLPFPTFTYLTNVSDPNTNRQTDMQVSGTGYTVNVPKTGTFPYSKRGQFVDVTFMNRYDGFSVSAPLLWYLPNVIESQLINFQNIAHSVLLNSTTLIVDLSTGEFHPHFTELDYFSTPGQEKILYTQPATSLRYNTHYAMVVQGLTTGSSSGTSSTLLPSSPLLQSYIKVFSQNQSSYVSDSIVDSLRYQRFKTSVFPVLNTIGVQLSRTQLIWDFHTASRGSLLQSLLSVHNSTLARVGQMLNLTSEELNEGATEYVSQLQPTSSSSSGSSSSIDKNLFSKSDIYRLIKYTQGTCSDASSGTMALTAYYRINVPWYLDSVKVSAILKDFDTILLLVILNDFY